MIPASFDESNCVLGAPPGTENECECLSVCKTAQGNIPVVISCWKLTKEELEIVVKTGRIWLGVWGATMPPVWLVAEKPFIQEENDD